MRGTSSKGRHTAALDGKVAGTFSKLPGYDIDVVDDAAFCSRNMTF
jgi:hypothetical protein